MMHRGGAGSWSETNMHKNTTSHLATGCKGKMPHWSWIMGSRIIATSRMRFRLHAEYSYALQDSKKLDLYLCMSIGFISAIIIDEIVDL
jgi:hypothetical protein